MTIRTLIRWSGLSAIAAGSGFVIVGLFHQLNIPSSIPTDTWANVHIVAMLMCFFGIFGVTGIYLRQAAQSGMLGLIGFLLLCIWFTLVSSFSFVEAFILPVLAAESPLFVEAFLGMFGSAPSTLSLALLPVLWMISGPAYILGQLFFGIAIFRSRIFPRRAGVLLIASAILTPIGGLVPAEHQPLVMLPIGIAFLWLGYALYSERQEGTVSH